jgi:hypothetical protein
VDARALFGRSDASVAHTNKETPVRAKPPYKLPALANHPNRVGPANRPRLATELIKAIPEAAANLVRNSLGSDQNGP